MNITTIRNIAHIIIHCLCKCIVSYLVALCLVHKHKSTIVSTTEIVSIHHPTNQHNRRKFSSNQSSPVSCFSQSADAAQSKPSFTHFWVVIIVIIH